MFRELSPSEPRECEFTPVPEITSVYVFLLMLFGFRTLQSSSYSLGGPSKSILKKTGSTSTYGRDSNVFEEDSGVATYTHPNNHHPNLSDSDTSLTSPHMVGSLKFHVTYTYFTDSLV